MLAMRDFITGTTQNNKKIKDDKGIRIHNPKPLLCGIQQ